MSILGPMGKFFGRGGGSNSPNVKAGVNIDIEAVKKLDKELQAVKKTASSLADEMVRAADASGRLVANASGGGGGTTNGMVTTGTNTSPGAMGGGGLFGGLRDRWANMGGAGRAAVAGGAGMAVGGVLSGFMGTVDRRIDQNRAYALPASRAGVEMQLRTGMSEMEYLRYRNLMVGDRNDRNISVDPTAMIGFENRTGISALQQRQSVGAIRALTGYSMDTQNVLDVMQQNLNPAVANQQFMMMGGLTMYGPGGEPRDYQSLMNARVNMFQLNNRLISRGAMREGSHSRHRMSMAGITPDEQDLLIQLGQAQSSFRERGGRGTFDPTNVEHRKIANVEDTLATQFDESERLQTKREEDMYRRQADNYADLERSNQSLIRAMNSLEQTLSGLTGFRASNRNWMQLGGRLLSAAGTVGLLAAGAAGAPLTGGASLAAAGAIAGGAMLSGDPPDKKGGGIGAATPKSVKKNSSSANDSNIKIPYGYGQPQGYKTLTEVKQHADFRKLHPTMQSRLLAMFRENPNVGIGDSHRSFKEQEAEFFRRHVETTKGNHDREYQGKYYKLVNGAPYAPPGRSMHEIGLASDLIGDLKWMNANAHRFGLQHFAGVNNEPWHVQPSDLPRSRADYEAAGAPWGTDGAFIETDESGEMVTTTSKGDMDSHGGGSSPASSFQGFADFTGYTIQEIVDTYLAGGMAGSAASSTGGGIGSTSRSPSDAIEGNYLGVVAADYDGPVSKGAEAAARAAFNAGFRGEDLATIVAIAGRESGWNSAAANPKSSDRGMWQINWSIHKSWLKEVGVNSMEDLFDIDKNAAAAYYLYKNRGNKFNDWNASGNSSHPEVIAATGGVGFDPNGDHLWHTGDFQGQAAAAAAAVTMSGDPPDAHSRSSSPIRQVAAASPMGAMSVNHSYHIEFSPSFNFDGVPQTPQMQQVAKEAANYLRDQVDLAMKRSQ